MSKLAMPDAIPIVPEPVVMVNQITNNTGKELLLVVGQGRAGVKGLPRNKTTRASIGVPLESVGPSGYRVPMLPTQRISIFQEDGILTYDVIFSYQISPKADSNKYMLSLNATLRYMSGVHKLISNMFRESQEIDSIPSKATYLIDLILEADPKNSIIDIVGLLE